MTRMLVNPFLHDSVFKVFRNNRYHSTYCVYIESFILLGGSMISRHEINTAAQRVDYQHQLSMISCKNISFHSQIPPFLFLLCFSLNLQSNDNGFYIKIEVDY